MPIVQSGFLVGFGVRKFFSNDRVELRSAVLHFRAEPVVPNVERLQREAQALFNESGNARRDRRRKPIPGVRFAHPGYFPAAASRLYNKYAA
jgi:hypothetical protein